MVDREHRKRIIAELRAVHMTSYGLLKMETAKLPEIIHPDEHIGGVIYGRTTEDKVGSAMLVATDKRIIFLDVKPIFSTMDEVSYLVVSGVKSNHVGPFAGVVLHTKIRDYGLRFVNIKCAETFVEYIEGHIELEKQEAAISDAADTKDAATEGVAGFFESLDTAVLSTVDREGNVHGSVVHYLFLNGAFFILTKEETAKRQHIGLHGQVSLTIHETGSLKTAQVSALATVEHDTLLRNTVYAEMSRPKRYKGGNRLAPVLTMKKGALVVLKLTPLHIKYKDYAIENS